AGRHATGILTLARGMTIRRFHLEEGQIRLVSSSEQEMLLGQLLIERQLLGPEALEKALAGRGRSRSRLCRLVLRDGLVTPAELNDILAEKVRRLLADALTWREGRFLYETPDEEPAARRSHRREIAVAVDLQGALEQIESADSDVLIVDDSDVI